ncbi:fucolectin-1-like [Mercenaria mercenaria]|uniref:fucolectin-1-like n=1 Tax=Mercenaria mercenaria TaxID=6596 RepID=UPI00234F2548|nr:fucolectin-1-like [Mercenaria mercenaria]
MWPCACSKIENYPSAVTDLGQSYTITKIHVFNRLDCCPGRLHDLVVYIGDDINSLALVARRTEPVGATYTFDFDEGVRGRYVKLQIEANEFLTICELEVFGCNQKVSNK